MEQIGIKNGINAINLATSKANQPSAKENNVAPFSTIEWTNKKDGNSYIAKKLTLKEGEKELTGVYVYKKDAKPDENGQIQGEFMSFDTFMKKIADEVPTVNSQNSKAYFPNIHQTNTKKTLPPQEKLTLDDIIENGTKLPDGSTILRPMICGVMHDIQKDDNGKYTLTTQAVRMGATPSTRNITPNEIVKNKWLCGGTVKKIGEDQYQVKYYVDGDPKKGTEEAILTKAECDEFMNNKQLYTY